MRKLFVIYIQAEAVQEIKDIFDHTVAIAEKIGVEKIELTVKNKEGVLTKIRKWFV